MHENTPTPQNAPEEKDAPAISDIPAAQSIPVPQNAPVPQDAPVLQTELTSAQKIGWFFVGVLAGVVGILVASLTNIDKPYRSDCTKNAIIGFIAETLLVISFLSYGFGVALYSIW